MGAGPPLSRAAGGGPGLGNELRCTVPKVDLVSR